MVTGWSCKNRFLLCQYWFPDEATLSGSRALLSPLWGSWFAVLWQKKAWWGQAVFGRRQRYVQDLRAEKVRSFLGLPSCRMWWFIGGVSSTVDTEHQSILWVNCGFKTTFQMKKFVTHMDSEKKLFTKSSLVTNVAQSTAVVWQSIPDHTL